MPLADFEVFLTNFRQRLASSSLRTVPGASSDKLSPALRQIRKHSAEGLLGDAGFLKRVHRMIEGYARQVQKKEEMMSTHRSLAAAVKQVRYAQNTLCTLQRQVKDIDERLKEWLGLAKREDLYEVLKSLAEARLTIESFERDLVSNLPAHKTKPHYRVPKWESLIEVYDHRAAQLLEKAAMQALWTKIKQELETLLSGKKISAATRFTIMSALLEAAGIRIEPSALKQHFYAQKKARTT